MLRSMKKCEFILCEGSRDTAIRKKTIIAKESANEKIFICDCYNRFELIICRRL